MKLRYKNYFLMIFIIYLFCILFFGFLGIYYSFDVFLIIFIILTFFVIFLLFLEIHDVNKRKIIKKDIIINWIKKQGYIIGGYQKHSGYKSYKQCLKILFENKIILVSNVSKNKTYKKVISDLKNVSVESEGVFRVKKIPVDIYIDGDEYYADLDSVKLD